MDFMNELNNAFAAKAQTETEAAAPAPAVHPSIMINRVGVFHSEKYAANPQTLVQKCAYFRVRGRMPHQPKSIAADAYKSMKQNAMEWYSEISEEEKRQLQQLYLDLPEEWR